MMMTDTKRIAKAIREINDGVSVPGDNDPATLYLKSVVRSIRSENELADMTYFTEETVKRVKVSAMKRARELPEDFDPADVPYSVACLWTDDESRHYQFVFIEDLATAVKYERRLVSDPKTRSLIPWLQAEAARLAAVPYRRR